MRRTKAFQLIIFTAILTAIGPLLAALYLARNQGLESELERVIGYARNVVDRSDRAVAQMNEALGTLSSLATEPCSELMLAEMRDLGLRMEFMKVAGHVAGDRMLCSTLGMHGEGLQLAPVEFITANGTAVRESAPVLFAEDVPYISLERSGFIAMAHRNQAVDLVVDQEGALLATFNPVTGEVRTGNADIEPRWIAAVERVNEAAFVDGAYIVGVVRSDEVSVTGAVAAIPVRYLNERIREFILLLVPVALLTGGCLTVFFLYFARMQTSLTSGIRQGLKRHEFYLLYQPIIELESGRCIGCEALLRWRRRDGDTIYPDAFIPIAEQSGLISELTARVIELAAADMGTYLEENPDFRLSVNLSARDLQSPETLQRLLKWIEGSKFKPRQLVVELTERMLVDQSAARQLIMSMRAKGINVAIDDFGTGYCSLSYLETMQFDSLKIDRLFVEAIDTEAATNKVVLHIIDMARTLDLEVVAEGVETESQARYLKNHGVKFAQGWLYSKAITAADFRSQYRR